MRDGGPIGLSDAELDAIQAAAQPLPQACGFVRAGGRH
jgi:hypothetical protein